MKIQYTRAMVNAAIEGRIPEEFERESFFGLLVPKGVPGVPQEVLNPRSAWNDARAYDAQAATLAKLFEDNFRRFEAHASDAVKAVAIHP